MKLPCCAAIMICCLGAGIGIDMSISMASAQDFPRDRELLLDAAPMRPSKRIPSLIVAADGRAVFDLWCRSIAGRLEAAADGSMTVTAETPASELAQAPLPAMQGPGQCSDPRQQADEALLTALTQSSRWQAQGEGVAFTGGPQPLRFRPATN